MNIITKNTGSLIILGLLVIAAAYYFVVQGPIARQTEACEANIAMMNDQIAVLEPQVTQKKQWEKELEELRTKSDGEIPTIAEYDNIINLMAEFNIIFDAARSYSFTFSDETIAENIVTRNIQLSFSTDSYATAVRLIRALHDSEYLYVIRNISIGIKRPSFSYYDDLYWDYRTGTDGVFDISMTLTDYEFHP